MAKPMTPSSAVCTTPVCESTINKAARLIQTNRYGSVPSPTGLHRDLVRLYPETDKVRIVTTNFDLLFDAAARDLFTKKPDLFKSPALPLGREFYGIVHVHGCLDRPQGMVLTDADLGRAYLTDGWASRFLVELFALAGSDPKPRVSHRSFTGRRDAVTLGILLARHRPAAGGQISPPVPGTTLHPLRPGPLAA